ncbi:MAG: GTPase ObgE [Christensenellaceae bacterium]|nr:GTPase ObgE [Christensenellaceae bacterium]
MIVDKVKIFIKAGNGGNGAISFHREKYVNAGGPDGGDGGKGGDLIFQASDEMRTLVDFRFAKKFSAENGSNGAKNNMTGKAGEDLIVKVPVGTVVIDEETGRVVADMHSKEPRVILKGGRGGKGNARFATPTRRTPRFSTPGRKTVGRSVILELKSIADVGLLGFPNVGKSTLLSVVSSAKPKIADYHFTTLKPNLGVVRVREESFVMADIPGLIEGAADGVGLGHDFLRHVERTRMMVHVVDASGIEGRDPVDDYEKIRHELELYSPELATRPEIVAANKMDITGAEEGYRRLKEKLEPLGIPVFPISAAARKDVGRLLDAVAAKLKELPPPQVMEEEGVIEEWEIMGTEMTFETGRGEDGIAEVNGTVVDEIFARIDPSDPASMRHFAKLLEDFGIIKALREMGVKDGEEVRLNGETFDFVE